MIQDLRPYVIARPRQLAGRGNLSYCMRLLRLRQLADPRNDELNVNNLRKS